MIIKSLSTSTTFLVKKMAMNIIVMLTVKPNEKKKRVIEYFFKHVYYKYG